MEHGGFAGRPPDGRESLMATNLQCWSGRFVLVFAACVCLAQVIPAADIVTLNNGMILEGELQTLANLKSDPLAPSGELTQILVIDNRLTRTYVAKKQVAKDLGKPAAVALERIPLQQRIPVAGNMISVVGMPQRIDPFDEWGRRTFVMTGQRGKTLEIVQGITEITPRWTKVEAIQGINNYIWSMKIATTSIPREQLSKILSRALDAKDAEQRKRIVRLYMQSDRFQDARVELEQLIKDFPDLAELNELVKELWQRNAQRIVKEIELRRDAGQFQVAVQYLESFPPDGVAGETLLKVRELLDEIRAFVAAGEKTVKLIDANVGNLRSDATRADVKAIVQEIRSELTINTLDRFGPFIRLADDPKMSAEQKLALAISGWLMGSAAALDNLETSIALVKLRDITRDYLRTARQADRTNLLSQLPSEANIGHLASIIANMKPPLPTEVIAAPAPDVGNAAAVLGLPGGQAPQPVGGKQADQPPSAAKPQESKKESDGSDECAPPKDKDDASSLLKGTPKPIGPQPKNEPEPPAEAPPPPPAPAPGTGTAQATGVPGLFELTVNTKLSEDPLVKYWVQLPPEYDPYRPYPCIVTLNGAATTPLQQIEWWSGGYSPASQMRSGQATRHGYIVIAPQWTREYQQEYQFSDREHAAILQPLRDACKRFSIDVDRVFLTGHSMGGTAAWDIGLSHPDLWAGVIPILATSGKYIKQYQENGRYVPMYFVAGEKDTATFANLDFGDWDHYLKHANFGYDVMIVQYVGRGHEASPRTSMFSDEIQNLFTWMSLHKRDFSRKQFEVESLRPWDNYFWWVEAGDPKAINMILPAEWGENPRPAKTPRPAKIEAKPIAPNGVRVDAGSSFGRMTVWLSPDLVTFNNTLKVMINGKPQKNVQPKIETLLEDVRTRGDRQHPFWAKVSVPD
jgi:predicted esterase